MLFVQSRLHTLICIQAYVSLVVILAMIKLPKDAKTLEFLLTQHFKDLSWIYYDFICFKIYIYCFFNIMAYTKYSNITGYSWEVTVLNTNYYIFNFRLIWTSHPTSQLTKINLSPFFFGLFHKVSKYLVKFLLRSINNMVITMTKHY